MGLIWVDNCGDNYSTGQLVRRWTGGVSNCTVKSSGRSNSNCMELKSLFLSPAYARRNLPEDVTQITFGFALSVDALSEIFVQGERIVKLSPRTVNIYLVGDGSLQIEVNSNRVLTNPDVVKFGGVWQYLEFSMKVSSGGVKDLFVRINNDLVLSTPELSGSSISNHISQIEVYNQDLNSIIDNIKIDDFYVSNTGGSTGSFLGDVGVYSLKPSTSGSVAQWGSNTGNPNFQNLNELVSDDDSTYNFATTGGLSDRFFFSSLPATVTQVKGLQVSLIARKDDAGLRSIKPALKIAGNTYLGNTKFLNSTYENHFHVWETNPNTLSSWTPSEVNSLEAGYDSIE